jgi:hypothetical protein
LEVASQQSCKKRAYVWSPLQSSWQETDQSISQILILPALLNCLCRLWDHLTTHQDLYMGTKEEKHLHMDTDEDKQLAMDTTQETKPQVTVFLPSLSLHICIWRRA